MLDQKKTFKGVVLHPHKKKVLRLELPKLSAKSDCVVRDVSAFALSATTEKKELASWWSSTPDDDFDFDFDFDVVSERRATTPKKTATRVVDDDGGGEAETATAGGELDVEPTPFPGLDALSNGEPPKQHHQLGGAGKNDDDVGEPPRGRNRRGVRIDQRRVGDKNETRVERTTFWVQRVRPVENARVEGARVGELFSSEKRRDAHSQVLSRKDIGRPGEQSGRELLRVVLHVRGRDERRRRWKRFDVYGPGRRKNREDCGGEIGR